MDSPERVVVLNQDFGIYLLEVAIDCEVSLSLPVNLRVTFDRLRAELPWTFNTGVFFETVVVCPIVDLDLFKVAFWA